MKQRDVLAPVSRFHGTPSKTQCRPAAAFKGIALFELLVAISTIAVVVGSLLPASQKVRESANRNTCTTIMRQAGIGFAAYETDMGKYPRRLAAGDDFGGHFADKLGLRFRGDNTLIGAGYEFLYVGGEKSFEFVAIPAAPGLTASTTQSIDEQSVLVGDDGRIFVVVDESPTEGADENRDRAFALIRECGKSAVARLLLDEGTADDARLVKSFVSGQTPLVFNDLDSDGDGLVTFTEIMGGEKGKLPAAVLACIRHHLQLGAGGEDVEHLPGVALKEVAADPADLFSYQEVCNSTIIATANAGVARASCQKLGAAESAELRGQLKVRNNILNSYQSSVSAQAGKKIDNDSADILWVLSEILKSEEK